MFGGSGDCPERLLIGFRNPDNSPRLLGWHPWPQAGERDCAATMPFALGVGFGLSGYAQTGCSIVFAIPEGSQTASRVLMSEGAKRDCEECSWEAGRHVWGLRGLPRAVADWFSQSR